MLILPVFRTLQFLKTWGNESEYYPLTLSYKSGLHLIKATTVEHQVYEEFKMGISLEFVLIIAKYSIFQEGTMCVANNSLMVLQRCDFFDLDCFKALWNNPQHSCSV